MKVMVMVKATQASEAGKMPSQQLMTDMGKFNQQLLDAGILLAADGLHPSSQGARVRFSGNSRTVINGPFTETNELLAGYWVWQVKSMEEAIDWVKRCPNPHQDDSEIEIRPIFDPADFGDVLTPELLEQEAGMRAQTLGLGAPRFEIGPVRLIAGLNASYTSETKKDIPKQWERFAPSIGNVPGQVGTTAYGVCWNANPNGAFDYLAGVEVANAEGLPADFTHVRLAPQRYAVFTHAKHISEIAHTLATIWTQWLPDCGLKTAAVPCFERYTEQFNPETGLGGTEIWIPIRRI